MRRRDFIAAVAGVTWSPIAARGDRSIPVIGLLWSTSTTTGYREAFARGLRENGYGGQNVALEERTYRLGDADDLRAAARQLVAQRVQLIFTAGTPAALAAKRATDQIPIVASAMSDPIADGLVASLARPGANLTGNTLIGPELVPKRLQILKQAVPAAARFAALVHPQMFSERAMQNMSSTLEENSRLLGIDYRSFNVNRADEFDGAFQAMAEWQAEALLTFPSPMFFENNLALVSLSIRQQLPTMYVFREAVEAGGLMSYGTDIPDLARSAAKYVAKILEGTKPSDLPVELPTKFQFIINLKTAQALGLKMPPTLLMAANELIE